MWRIFPGKLSFISNASLLNEKFHQTSLLGNETCQVTFAVFLLKITSFELVSKGEIRSFEISVFHGNFIVSFAIISLSGNYLGNLACHLISFLGNYCNLKIYPDFSTWKLWRNLTIFPSGNTALFSCQTF